MDDKLYPLIVLLVGIVVVFVGLVSLVFIVKLMALICSGFAKKEKKASVANLIFPRRMLLLIPASPMRNAAGSLQPFLPLSVK